MREYEVLLDKTFTLGLRRDGPGEQEISADIILNLCPRPDGNSSKLVGYQTRTPISFASSWPHPQVFETLFYTFMTKTDGIYLTKKNGVSVNQFLTGLSGGNNIFECVDFGTVVFLLHGTDMISYNGTAITQYPNASLPNCSSYCRFEGYLVGCGVKSTWYECTDKYMIWSEVLEPSAAINTRNIAGYAPVFDIGSLLRIKRLGASLLVYGSSGIAMATYYPEAATFGLKKISDVGLKSRTLLVGTEQQHMFVCPNGDLYRVDQNGIVRLGYAEYMNSLQSPVVALFDPIMQDYYFSDSTHTYMLTSVGLCELSIAISAILSSSMAYNGYMPTWRLDTGMFDRGRGALKTLTGVEASVYTDSAIKTRVKFTNAMGLGVGMYTPYYQLSPKGTAFPVVTALRHGIELSGSSVLGTVFRYAKMKFKYSDKHAQRGSLATPTNEGASSG